MAQKMNINEQELIEAVRRNDRTAQRQLYDRYSPKMFSICLRYMESRDDASDMLQEGFIKVFTSIDKFGNLGSFEGWMRRIFVNVCLENIRQVDILRQGVAIEESDVIEDYDHSVLDKISADELMVLISEMPPGFRTIFNLFAIEGYSHKEIADMLNIAEASSRSQFTRAKRYLQERVKKLY